jgi:DNA gyrase/topoisomerase IV subunit A
MQSLSLHQSAARNEPLDLSVEVARLEAILNDRRNELAALQEEFREFKTRYTQTIGSRLAELAEIERAIREAEERVLGVEAEEETEDAAEDAAAAQTSSAAQVGGSLRKLFWAVAKMFHPDHAADEKEARRRHTVMAEASRAYREGDVESLHTLLGDEELQFFCTTTNSADDPQDLASRLIALKEELRTVEFGIKRTRQDGLYQLKLKVDEEALSGRDALGAQAESINRQIVKARYRLAHLS